jgi:hypothetical protein
MGPGSYKEWSLPLSCNIVVEAIGASSILIDSFTGYYLESQRKTDSYGHQGRPVWCTGC